MLVELPPLEEDDVVAAAAVEEVVDADVDNAVAVAVLGDDVVDSGD
jgi:hypothetical protein